MTANETKQATNGKSKSKKTAAKGSGIAKVAALADEELRKNGKKFLTVVAQHAEKGELPSLGMLVKLAERVERAEEHEATLRGRSQAMAWGEEPEWKGESSEDAAETGAGSREPEE